MNPGTTILILLGIIGLLLYASKAFAVRSTEGFTPVDESQISNVGRTALENLTQGPNGMSAIFSAFSTPDINTPPPVAGLPGSLESGPSVDTFAANAMPSVATAPLTMPSVPATALPINAPPSVLGVLPPPPLPTTSDLQGSGVLTAPPPSASIAPATAPLPLSVAPLAGPTLSDLQGIAVATAPPPAALPQSLLPDVAATASLAPPVVDPPIPAQCPPPVTCPPLPDMSMYVRKDQIPCWGCNLK